MDIRDPAHQAREGPLSPYEDAMADALEVILGEGKHELEEIVAALNAAGVKCSDGMAWTEESFRREMARLGT